MKNVKPYRIRYNFISDHSSIKKTPAEQAGIKLDLGQNKTRICKQCYNLSMKLTQCKRGLIAISTIN